MLNLNYDISGWVQRFSFFFVPLFRNPAHFPKIVNLIKSLCAASEGRGSLKCAALNKPFLVLH